MGVILKLYFRACACVMQRWLLRAVCSEVRRLWSSHQWAVHYSTEPAVAHSLLRLCRA